MYASVSPLDVISTTPSASISSSPVKLPATIYPPSLVAFMSYISLCPSPFIAFVNLAPNSDSSGLFLPIPMY